MAMARVPRMTGAFHGAMPSTTPAGWRMPMASVPGLSEGMISPWIWVVIAPASRSMLAASMTLNPAQGAVAPVSSIISVMNSADLAVHHVGGLHQDGAALARAGLRPALEGGGGGLDGGIGIGDAGGGGAGRELAGERIMALEAARPTRRRVPRRQSESRYPFPAPSFQKPRLCALTAASRPPSAAMFVPLIQRAPSEQRKAITGAMSDAVPARPRGRNVAVDAGIAEAPAGTGRGSVFRPARG